MKRSYFFEKLLWKSLIFFIFLYVVCFGFRAFFILYLGVWGGAIGESSGEYLQTFINGARYDGQIVGALAVVYFVLALFLGTSRIGEGIRKLFVSLVIFVLCFVNIANIGFYQIYGDVFNTNLLGLVFDDRMAIFETALSGQYHLGVKIFACIVISIALMWILRAFFSLVDFVYCTNELISSRMRQKKENHLWKNLALFCVFVFGALFAINGHFGLQGISLGKEIKPVENVFLRKATSGALRDLHLVYRAYSKISHSSFDDYVEESPIVATQKYFNLPSAPENTESSHSYNLLELLQKTSSNTSDVQINHIFYIVAESMSEWHFDKKFDELNLTSELKKLVEQKGAYKADVFLQGAGNTIGSLDSQISGLLHTEIPLSLMVGRMEEFKSAPAVIFRDLGFKTHFYYGGSGTWQKLDSYITAQGFDDILYSTHIIQNAKNRDYAQPYENSWGAYDHLLFLFVRDRILLNNEPKTFNMIMTTSNHPPYDVPLQSFGAPMEEIEAFLKAHPEITQKSTTKQILGHIWYQDKMIAKFVEEMSARFPNSIFVITGDHYDREYPFAGANVRINNSVPLIIYAPKLNPVLISGVGSHIDITPTLVELTAPNGYKYVSFGAPLLSNKMMVYEDKNEALGLNVVATDRFIYDGYKVEYFGDGLQRAKDTQRAQELFSDLQRAKALSWWILKNGYKIEQN
ncbi:MULTISPECIES: LTA synthase family protein [unclassified Helicobacter]|uniref:LTA synthase family protein n=1 Tax=unclassified Helicobacter TaxID=2593540 RepID=UPI0015F12936|nr:MULTISPECIES: alkaline phosphatase family protein [unclassified Helicobacter]